MEITLVLAGLRLRFLTERPLYIDPVLNNFIISAENPDVTVRVSWDWEHLSLPDVPQLGEDALCCYYRQGDTLYCLTRGGGKGPVACSAYDRDYREILCVLNEKPFLLPPKDLGSILRMIPLRAIFQRFGVLFFHASRISHMGKAILFTAPSGTGKTTQARLWEKYRGGEVLCNDRTLLRKVGGFWQTYGYPLDGSEPVRSSAVNTLGALVLLEQGPVNEVGRLPASKALPRLMPQVVMDCWSGEARARAMELLLELLRDIPVYLLACTPDERAVEALEKKLTEDEVIPRGEDFRPPVE